MDVDQVAPLRGAASKSLQRRSWYLLGALGLVAFAVVIAVAFASVVNHNASVSRLKNGGIHVTVIVESCLGNIGGSGSNSAGFTCHGHYRIGNTPFHELIGSLTTYVAPGTSVQGVVDPAQPSKVVLASAVRRSNPSEAAFIAPVILLFLFLTLSVLLIGKARRQLGSREPFMHARKAPPVN